MNPITLRPACASDAEQLAALWQATIAEDDDPDLWQAWLAESVGTLTLATAGDVVVGMLHYAQGTPEEAFIEGVRVAPEWEDRSIATLLVQRGLQLAREHEATVIRASVAESDLALAGILTGAGFAQIGSYAHFIAPTAGVPSSASAKSQIHQPEVDALETLWTWLEGSSIAPLLGEMQMVGNHPAALTDDALVRALQAGQVWVLRGLTAIDALMIAGPGGQEGLFTIRYLDGTSQGISQLALHLRGWAATQSFEQIDARPPDLLIVHDALGGAGFTRIDTATRWMYAKPLG